MILAFDFVVSIRPKSGSSVAYLLLSAVGRSRVTVVGEVKSTFALSLSIFLRYKLAITVVVV